MFIQIVVASIARLFYSGYANLLMSVVYIYNTLQVIFSARSPLKLKGYESQKNIQRNAVR